MPNSTKWDVPKGSVAKKLPILLYPELKDHEIESIIVCLMAHLLIEENLNGFLYRWLKRDAPLFTEEEEKSKFGTDLWKEILKMDFAKKYSLVEPFFRARFPKEASKAWKINTLRKEIVHGKPIKDARYEGKEVSEESTIEAIFLAAQSVTRSFDKFEEMLDAPHAEADRWKKRLLELGESLF